jgi:hypothetical protein
MTRDQSTDGGRELTSSFGMGGHFALGQGRFFVDVDALATGFFSLGTRPTTPGSRDDGLVINSKKYFADYERRMVSSLRVQAGCQLASHLALVAGPTLNVAVADDPDDRVPRGVDFASAKWSSEGTTVRLYPGLVAGLQF